MKLEPHLGHAFSITLADAISRWHAIKQPSPEGRIVLTGTDEHGAKIMKAAALAAVKEHELCDESSESFRDLSSDLISADSLRFWRTSNPVHKDFVQKAWVKLMERGFLQKEQHRGWYCTSEETFIPESQIPAGSINGSRATDRSGRSVELVSECNYFLLLDKLSLRVRNWLLSDHGKTVLSF